MKFGISLAALTAGVLSATVLPVTAVQAAAARMDLSKPAGADWPVINGDEGATKFSTLTQLTPANVGGLKQAWVYDTGEPAAGFRGWQITPIVVDGVMYFPTSARKVVALNADTGQEIWKFDMSAHGMTGNSAKYGVTFWPGEGRRPNRIVVASTDGKLFQLDAKTGELNRQFADNGFLDLKKGVMERFGGNYTPGTTPAIYKNVVIISPTTGEQGRYGVPGDPRGFDLITGKELWRFHTVPRPGEENFGDWGLNGWQDRRGPGTWVPMTVDTERGIVYIALGNATDQNFGGSRPGNNSYATSVIALDAVTGKRKWHFAITKHDIFDWDVNAPPTFIDVRKDGKVIPAIAQSTKVGYMWILNRETGEPVFGAEEKQVPFSDAPGEYASPTQPYPLKPAPISRVEMTRKDVSAITPEGKAACEKLYDNAVNMGPNTPYLMVPALVFPSSEGGGSWAGAAYDQVNRNIILNVRNLGTVAVLRPSVSSGVLDSFAKQKIPFDDPEGFPCSPAPWGELMAISADTGDTVWKVPLGEYKDLTARGVPKTGTPNAGGPVVTAGGLIFIGATTDKMFRAFDARTGQEIWSTELTNNAPNTPMTYMGKNGKQYVTAVVSSGLNAFNRPRITQANAGTNKLVTFSLP